MCEGSFLPSVFVLKTKTTGFRFEPSLLSNQSFAVFALGWARLKRLRIARFFATPQRAARHPPRRGSGQHLTTNVYATVEAPGFSRANRESLRDRLVQGHHTTP